MFHFAQRRVSFHLVSRAVALLVIAGTLFPADATAASARPAYPTRSRAEAPPNRLVFVRGMSFDPQRHTLVLAVTRSVAVSTRSLPNPMRLVIDLPGARLAMRNRELMPRDTLVHRVRVAQYSVWPPIVRVVLEPVSQQEPILAVQQGRGRVFISVAEGAKGAPTETPETEAPSPQTIPEGEAPDLPAQPAPTTVSPAPVASPEPPSKPSSLPPLKRPGIQQRLRPGTAIPRPSTSPTAVPTVPPGSDGKGIDQPEPPRIIEEDTWLLPQPGLVSPSPLSEPLPPPPGVPMIPPGAEASESAVPPGGAATPQRRTEETGSETVPKLP